MTAMRRMLPAATIIVLGIALTGCQKSFWVRQYPEFYTPDLKTVAVTPFYNETAQVGIGEIYANRLARALKANGTYDVLGPRELAGLFAEKELQPGSAPSTQTGAGAPLAYSGAGPSPPGARRATVPSPVVMEALRNQGKAQACIVGTLVSCSAIGSRSVVWDEPDGYPYYAYRPYYPYYGHYRYGWGYGDYPDYHYEFVTEAHVAVEASMLRVSDGKVLHSTPTVHATAAMSSYSPRPARDVLDEAMNTSVRQLLGRFAIVPVKISVSEGKDFRTALRQRDGTWEFSDKFGAADEQMYVVLRLPRPADRNSFRLTITPKGQPNNVLASEDFQWSREDRSRGFVFSPKQIAAGMGPGSYSVNFHSGGELVMKHGFRIE
jgi:hypothetical protein